MKRKIFAVLGVQPEPGGYALAKFSRTPVYKSYQDWVVELSEKGAEKFYNSFYFQYGHASIADLAHVAMVVENISQPARFLLLDDQLIDAQSRSTRYVDYSKCEFITPPEIKNDSKTLSIYQQHNCNLIALYQKITERVTQLYLRRYSSTCPADMDKETLTRALYARSFDVARYVLPFSLPKGMGVLASARTWERIITKFLSSPLLECQEIGVELQQAICQKPAFNPALNKLNPKDFRAIFGKNIALPTLVKYAQKNTYQSQVYDQLKNYLPKIKTLDSTKTALHERIRPEIDLVTTLLYRVSDFSYRQLLSEVKKFSPAKINKIIEIVYRLRGEHDSLLRELNTGNLIFDLCLDIGAYRDLHRHRNVIHIIKDFRPVYGFACPREIKAVGLAQKYQEMMKKAEALFWRIEKKYPHVGQYVLPLATYRRVLMRMTPWELQYLTELRTKPTGHFSYRQVAYTMYRHFARRHPAWAKHFRVTDYRTVDFWQR
ncbi:MAG: FAD-dependent thymidylate synthase [Candidatus Shapirobacteria bacterium]